MRRAHPKAPTASYDERVDALDKVLETVRLTTALLSRAQYTHPWSVETRGAEHPIFHGIVHGRCQLKTDSSWHTLETGDIAILPAGTRHVMASDRSTVPVGVSTLPASTTGGRVVSLRHGGRGEPCHILCGTFRFDATASTWLLATLPGLIHVRAENATSWTRSTLALLDGEVASDAPGAAAMVTRLTDVLVVKMLRSHAESTSREKEDWLGAAADPQIGRALVCIHTEPAHPWTSAELARRAGLSRSKFFERFNALVGESPARYVARWRASAAADMLERGDASVAEIADRVGYESPRAFVDMFRRHHGLSPAAFRKRAKKSA